MTYTEGGGSSHAAPIDETDRAILGGIRRAALATDPVPPDLIERIQFSLELADCEPGAELMQLQEEMLTAAVRGEEARTITFDSESLTIMVSVQLDGPETVRIDGWLAPPAPYRVELRIVGGERVTMADDEGRFVLDKVPHGLAQIVVRVFAEDWSQPPRPVIAPSIVV